jgi:2-phosphosulfolactate phosphatase
MPRLHVLTNKNQADPERLGEAIAIVVDVIFATTGIALALERGAADVVPTADPESARAQARTLAPHSFVLAGEQDGKAIPGFIEPWPSELMHADLAGKRIVYSTTNGTVALNLAARASLVLAAAPVNAKAVADYVYAQHRGRDVVLICAGSGPAFSLEDFYGAGCIASHLAAHGADFKLSDAANAARLLHDGAPANDCVADTYAGRMMAALGLGEDLQLCSQQSIFGAVPVFAGGRITRA